MKIAVTMNPRKAILSTTVLMNLAAVASTSASPIYAETDLVPFYTDGCTYVAEGLPRHPNEFLHCCYAHDKKYFAGGTFDQRKSADLALAACVEKASGSETVGSLYYWGVRVGGTPYRHTSYRWGYGWPYGRFYAPLQAQEQIWVEKQLSEFNCLAGLNEFTYDSAELHRSCD